MQNKLADLTAYFDSFLRALSLCDKHKLKRISFIDNSLVDNQIAKFVNALQDHHNLIMLDISSNEISHHGFLALSKLLHQPWSKIHSLRVNQSDLIADKCIKLLSGAMVVNKTIQKFGSRRTQCNSKWLEYLILRHLLARETNSL